MRVPVDWLKEYIEIPKDLSELSWKLTEIGLSVEKIDDTRLGPVFELEITPNRPDLLSIIGIAREVAALTGKSVNLTEISIPNPGNNLSIQINNDFSLFSRYSGIIIDNVKIRKSPSWMQTRLLQLNLRPINVIVDITNYVMFEMGIPLHAFDYQQITGKVMTVTQANGGEEFTTVDELSYKLPRGAIIIKDSQRIIDLAGIKGGLNSGINSNTKTVYLHSTANNPVLVRKAAQELNLHSDASNIYERCPDPEGTLSAVKRASRLILDHAGGLVSSEIIDLKKDIFKPRKITLHLPRLAKVSGFEFPKDKVINILSGLNLKPEQTDGKIDLSIPSYRNDLKLEEDIIEEIARIYGYNNLPKTLPASPPPTTTIAYNYSYKADNEVKRILQGLGYTEIYTYSLISKSQISTLTNCLKTSIKIENPVSLEFEYLRPTLIVNLIEAVKLNQANFLNLKLFELGRTYHKTPKKTETNTLTLISNQGNFLDLKGSLELLFKHLGIEAVDFVKADETTVYDNPLFDKNQIAKLTGGKLQMGIIAKISAAAVDREEIKTDLFAAEINFDLLKKKMNPTKFKPIPTYPPIIEDLTLRLPKDVQIGDLIKEISLIDRLINQIQIQSFFNDKITFRIRYQSASGNLTSLDIQKIRKKIISRLQAKYSVSA